MRRVIVLALALALTVGLGQRLLMSASGSGAFTPPPPTPSGVLDLTAAPSGGWIWFLNPVAIEHDGVTIFGYVRGDNGNAVARTYDDGTTSAEVTLRTLHADDHANPSFLMRPDGVLLTFYARHNDSTIYRKATTSLSPLTFGTETSMDAELGGTQYDYWVPVQLTGETNDPIYLFYRNVTSWPSHRLTVAKSTNGGSSWGTGAAIAVANQAYWRIERNGTTRIDVAITDEAPLSSANVSVWHFYYEGDKWYKSDGTEITDSKPFAPSAGTRVYDGTGANDTSWVQDLAIDPLTGHPVIVYATYPSTSDHRYWYARWTGSAWVKHQIAAAGGYIAAASVHYSGGVAIDRADARIVYASRQVGSDWEMFRYVTADGGETWTETQLTTGSGNKQIRPTAVYGSVAGPRVLWMAGTYTSYTNWNTGTRGYR